MRRIQLLLTAVILLGTSVVLAQEPWMDYAPLRAAAVKLPKAQKPGAESYTCYILSTTYAPSSLTCPALPADPANDRPPVWLSAREGLSVRDKARLNRFARNLCIIEPEAGDNGAQLLLRSVYASDATDGENRSEITAEPFQPQNDHLSGLRLPFNGAEAQLIYAFSDEGKRNFVLEPHMTCESSVCEDLCTDTLRLWLEGADFRDIRSGYFELNLLAPEHCDMLRLSAADVGRKVKLGDIPMEVAAFGPGFFHVVVPVDKLEQLAKLDVDFFAPGVTFSVGSTMSGYMLSLQLYQEYRRMPGLSFSRFVKQFGTDTANTPRSGECVLLINSNCNASEVVLNLKQPSSPVASRVISFSRDDSGEYTFSLLRKDANGVLRPQGGNPQGMEPPHYAPGDQAMAQFIGRMMRYPAEALEQGIQGSVIVRVVIGADGQVVSTELLRSVHPALDAEALRVVNQLKEWTPALVDGLPTQMAVTIPIIFRYQ